jgi:phosphoenolpyruvate carboxykinase (ATP)
LKKRVADFLRGRRQYLEAFEGKYGRIPESIRESLPYRETGNAVLEKMNCE